MKIVERDPAAWREVLLGAVLFLTALFALGRAALPAQSTDRPAETPLMRQLRQALRLAQQGDQQGAMALTLQLLQQNPKFVPAIKLKGMLREEAQGRT
jgi:hypothetical protein